MSAHENKATIRDYFDAFNRDWEGAIERYIEDAGLGEHIRFFQHVLPYRLEMHDALADGDEVAVRATVHGVHRGELSGVAPAGRSVSFPMLIIYRLAHGKIVEHWMQADQAALMQQITAEPAKAGAGAIAAGLDTFPPELRRGATA